MRIHKDGVWVNPHEPFYLQPDNRKGSRFIHHADDASTEEAASISQDRLWIQTNLKNLGDAVRKEIRNN